MAWCSRCGTQDHDSSQCTFLHAEKLARERRDDEQKRDREQQRRDEDRDRRANERHREEQAEQRARDREAAHHQRAVEAHSRAVRAAAERTERREQKRLDEESERQERYENASTRLLSLKKSTSMLLRRRYNESAPDAWVLAKVLAAEAADLEPRDFDPAERADFAEFVERLDELLRRIQSSLGPDERKLRIWLRLHREGVRLLAPLVTLFQALKGEAFTSAEAAERLAAATTKVEKLRATCPPPVPESLHAHYKTLPVAFRKEIVAIVRNSSDRRPLAEAAWRHLSERGQPVSPRPRSPRANAWRQAIVWTVGIGVLFTLVPLFLDRDPATFMAAGIAYSPIGLGGVGLATVLGIMGSKARRREAEEHARFQTENTEFSRQLALLIAVRNRTETELRTEKKRIAILCKITRRLAVYDRFRGDPRRGGRLAEFAEWRPDLDENMHDLATMTSSVEEDVDDEDDVEVAVDDDVDGALDDLLECAGGGDLDEAEEATDG